MSIGQNIRKYRKEKDYTQRELADLIGVSVQAISKWETDAGAPDISQIVPLASVLDISTDALLDYTHRAKSEDFALLRRNYREKEVFREPRNQDAEKHYSILHGYFSAHPQDSGAASMCLEYLVDRIVAGQTQNREKSELIAECEKYAACVSKYETDADTVFRNQLVLARGYSALGEAEKADAVLQKIPVTFGDRLYWEAELAQANQAYDDALQKCRASFALKARYISRCIRMAGEICQTRDGEAGFVQRTEYEEYMLRLLNAFLSGGDYLPCRQIFQKHILLRGMVRNYVRLNRFDLALERAEMLFAGRAAFLTFLENQHGKQSLLFENNDSPEYQARTKAQLDSYAAETATFLQSLPNYEQDSRIRVLLTKYALV